MTISPAELDSIVDGILEVCGEDYQLAARVVRLLNSRAPGIPWQTCLRARAALWAPYRESGLSIDWWCDEVARLAA